MSLVPPARHLQRAKDVVDARYAEPLTVADLARAAKLSTSAGSSSAPSVSRRTATS